jgi:hypothetical protein
VRTTGRAYERTTNNQKGRNAELKDKNARLKARKTQMEVLSTKKKEEI